MPAMQDLIKQWSTETKTSSVGLFAVILAVVVFVVVVVTGGAGVGLAAAAYGAGSGAGYAVLSGGDLNAAQQNMFGSTNGGAMAPSGYGASTDPNVQQYEQDSTTKNVVLQIGAAGAGTAENAAYNGNCPFYHIANGVEVATTASECELQGLDPGVTWRPVTYEQYNSTRALQERMAYCTSPTGGGFAVGSAAAMKCAAPAPNPMGIPGG